MALLVLTPLNAVLVYVKRNVVVQKDKRLEPERVIIVVMLVHVMQVTTNTTINVILVHMDKQVLWVHKAAVLAIHPKKMTVLLVPRLFNVKATYANPNVATTKVVQQVQLHVTMMVMLVFVVQVTTETIGNVIVVLLVQLVLRVLKAAVHVEQLLLLMVEFVTRIHNVQVDRVVTADVATTNVVPVQHPVIPMETPGLAVRDTIYHRLVVMFVLQEKLLMQAVLLVITLNYKMEICAVTIMIAKVIHVKQDAAIQMVVTLIHLNVMVMVILKVVVLDIIY